ncbi:MAG TPA: prolyl oligopeptidase family serine peptidase, partial [Vicinamibacterales bacterium]|nr:prolyl oligopeptidase family serine peptidase [Vicinamibacterales bacterium]
MKQSSMTSLRAKYALAVLLSVTTVYALPQAQTTARKPLSSEDYVKWRSITGQELSGDGKWLTYVLQLTNVPTAETKPVLHLLNLETNVDVAVPDGTAGVFSPDSKWIAYQITPETPRGRGRGAGAAGGATPGETPATPPATPPVTPPDEIPATPPAPGAQPAQPAGRGAATPPTPPRRVELRNLATGQVRSWENIGTITFSPTSTHVILKRRGANDAAGGRGGRGGAAPAAPAPGAAPGAAGIPPVGAGPRGTDTILLDLRTGRHQLLGSVADIAFNRTGTLLGYTVDGAVKDGNGLFVFDTRSGRIVPLDNDALSYERMTWNEDADALAVLKGKEVDKMREKDNVLVAFTDVPAAIGLDDIAPTPVVFDPKKADNFPKGWVVSERATLQWSEDNKRIFFGMKEQVAAPDTTRRTTDEQQDVDVWNTMDERVQSLQMIRAEADRNFTFRQVFDLSASRFVKLADATMRDLDVAPDGKWAVGRDQRGYMDEKKRPAADFYRVNTSTGERTLMMKGQQVGGHTFGISPHGTHFLFWKDSRFQAYDLNAGTASTLGNGTSVSFIDVEDDHPGTKPSFGLAGFTSDGKAAIAQHRYDLWLLPLDGSSPKNLTNGVGTKNDIRFRYARVEPIDLTVPRAVGPRGTIDLSKPIMLTAYGQWTKKSGFYELKGGELKELIYDDASFSAPEKAAKADRFVFTRQTFIEFPDLRVSGLNLADSKKITDANPQQKDYMWGRRILFDYKNKDGVRLQGVLALPDDYKEGEKRPMLVTFYEKNSQNLHRYNAPSYLTGMGGSPMEAVSRGYLTMLPDIHYRTGNSHSDQLEGVEAATRKVIEMGYADPKRIGVTGHSYGGEGAAFIGTQSKMFAAVGMGAGVTDLFNDFAQPWGWSYQVSGGSGATAFDYYLYGQGRWGFSPWDNPEKYRSESALVHANKVTVPFLIMHGTADPTVGFENGLAFYNALRYNGKKAVLLAYPNEGHGLRGMAN